MACPRTTHQWLKPLYDFIDSTLSTISGGAPDFTVDAVATSALTSNVYANGTAGVGATLTGSANGAMDTVDGFAPVVNKTYLIAAEVAPANNGLYKLTVVGDVSTKYVLTRLTTFDQSAEMKQDLMISVRSGTVNANTTWKSTFVDGPTVGSTSLTFVRDPLTVTTNTTQSITGVKTMTTPTLVTPVISTGMSASGSASNDFSGSTGTFKTSSGAGTLSGTTNVAANKDLTCSAGTTALDLSLGTGVFKTTTGLHTIGGKIAATASAWAITDPANAGAIPVTASGVCNLTSAGAETRTLAVPTFIGQRLVLCMDTDGGDIVVTVASAYNMAGNTIITLNDAGDHVELVGCTIGGSRRWRIVNNDGAALS